MRASARACSPYDQWSAKIAFSWKIIMRDSCIVTVNNSVKRNKERREKKKTVNINAMKRLVLWNNKMSNNNNKSNDNWLIWLFPKECLFFHCLHCTEWRKKNVNSELIYSYGEPDWPSVFVLLCVLFIRIYCMQWICFCLVITWLWLPYGFA